uniref:Cytochrome p450 n=1 Tax=Croton stellatopilosus TaxID=431156 RepID=A0A3G2CK09_9ROSI|nr:cytochrome p450 [Croton stellatopilosus]
MKNKLPPGPRGLPIIGNLLELGARPHESLTNLAKIHGPLMTIQLGLHTTIVATSAEMAKEILLKNDQAFLGRPIPHAVTAEHNYQRSVAWLSGGPKWKSLRKICNTHLFTPQRIDLLQGLRNEMINNGMVKSIQEACDAKQGVNIGRIVFGTTLNLLSNSMFSGDMLGYKSINAIEELKILIGKIMELSGKPNLSDYFPFLKPFDPQGIKKQIKISYDHLHELIDGIVGQRIKKRETCSDRYGDFLDILLDQTKDCGTDEFNREDAIILLADLFIGGTDTTTTTTEWAMTELIRNPKIMEKAKQELVETIGKGKILQEKDTIQLPYLQSIIKETMRLHTTAPLLLPHMAQMDVEICGYTIPKHTQVIVNAWALARDPTYWDNPTEFIPERFMNSGIDFRGTNFYFVPFSSGRRICPGVALGIRIMCLELASLIYHFDWELPNGMAINEMDMGDKFGTTLQKATPLIAIPQLAA